MSHIIATKSKGDKNCLRQKRPSLPESESPASSFSVALPEALVQIRHVDGAPDDAEVEPESVSNESEAIWK